MPPIEEIENEESMASVRAKLNAAIAKANTAGLPVATFADLPADPVDGQAHLVRSLGIPIYWDATQSAWINTNGATITADDE